VLAWLLTHPGICSFGLGVLAVREPLPGLLLALPFIPIMKEPHRLAPRVVG
jgi:hypothetical protein